jgi:hypothetical protein
MTDNNRIQETDVQALNDLAKRYPKIFQGLVLPWFTPDGYMTMRAAAADRQRLCDTYGEFERVATSLFNEAVRKRQPVEKVTVDADALIAWCKSEARPLDGFARQYFAILTVIDQNSRGGHA